MKSMWAAVYRGQDELSVESVPIPEIGPGEMLVRVDVCGVCPTDIKKIHKGLLPPPRIFGHEIAGTVAEIGAQVQGFRAGDRVVVHHHIPCGSCFYCRHQAYAQCAHYKVNGTTAGFEPSGGGFAEYVRVMDWIVARGTIPIPGSVTAEEASFVEPVNTCLKAVQVANTQPGETVLVVGQGPIGLLLAQIARFAGAAVYVSDTLADRREMGLKMGAELALDGRADVVAEMRAITAGRGVDCVFLAAPGRAAFQQAVDATRPAGRVMVFSATSVGETAEVELGLLCTSEKQILTSYSSSVDIQELAA
ncbi:MAG: alcohol dehydrogenase catalytic domain-containing protein, partial [Vicinamibacteria bacterium]|nr:alcohol dehydrogenase catalytic domain-containing protein [Vicinamibacteria bacterium]